MQKQLLSSGFVFPEMMALTNPAISTSVTLVLESHALSNLILDATLVTALLAADSVCGSVVIRPKDHLWRSARILA